MPYQSTVNATQQLTTFDITLPTSRIEGTLIGPAPKPQIAPGFGTIQVWPAGASRIKKLPPHAGCSAQPDPNGHFTIEHLGASGRYTLVGYGLATSAIIDRPDQVVSASLQPPTKTGEIAGTITHLPPPGGMIEHTISVTAFPKDDQEYDFHVWNSQAQCDPKTGAYRIRNIPIGTYGLLVSDFPSPAPIPSIWVPTIEVRDGVSRDLSIDIPQSRPIVVTENRSVCTGWRLKMPSGDWLDESLFVGEFALPLGQYTIESAYGRPRLTVTQKLTVEPGNGTQHVTIKRAKLTDLFLGRSEMK